ncbi:hypothetical protein C5167_040891 [Papaver somniferum]|uniref:Peptidase A1 domain-containing protein n=1 Tax=Papaver somniferum TaxID=3469 RepID=A0A4Y7IKF1_PAPSO|nr:hypothetical protein C5167_040891 [Papaver somniferum]
MASYSSFFAILLLSFFFLSASGAQPPSSSRPSGLVFSVTIDPSTLQYLTKISLETVPINVVVDLGGAEGIAGLGRSGLSLASQLSAAFQLPQKFALDLSSPSGGSMYFGNGPYPDQQLAYTPLITNSCFPSDYFVDVKSMEIDNGNVTYDEGMLSIDNENGVGGTKFSTLVPYTTMETSIYKAFTSIYINRAQAMNISAVAPAWPFHACFSASTIQSRPDGLVVPKILFRLSNNVNWMISPGNALKLVKKDVYCLAFVDGGSKPKTSIVIGGHQMQYNIIEFDVARSRLGFRPRVQI